MLSVCQSILPLEIPPSSLTWNRHKSIVLQHKLRLLSFPRLLSRWCSLPSLQITPKTIGCSPGLTGGEGTNTATALKMPCLGLEDPCSWLSSLPLATRQTQALERKGLSHKTANPAQFSTVCASSCQPVVLLLDLPCWMCSGCLILANTACWQK